jgi:hypothetical protein
VTVHRRQRWRYQFERDGEGRIVAVEIERLGAGENGRLVRVDGHQVVPIVQPVVGVLQRSGVSGRQLADGRAFELWDPPGTQIELLLDAVRPVRRHDRLVGIAEGVAAMSTEEATYWHARAQRPGGLPALRTLLVGGHR